MLLFAVVSALGLSRAARAHEGVTAKLTRADARIAATPADARLRFERAELHRIDRNWRAALADLACAERLDPALTRIDLARARVLCEAGDAPRAVAVAKRYVERETRDVDGGEWLARAFDAAGDAEAAAGAWGRAVALTPENPDLHFARAQQFFAMGGAGRRFAIAAADEGVARTGALQLEELALRYETELGEWDAALARTERLGRVAPRPAVWRERATELLERAGRRVQTLAACEALAQDLARLPAGVRALATTKDLMQRVDGRRARVARSSRG
ncbi:MAG: hypothetical protein EXS13_02785 [Planctomycetes bacterium]|nr:hypothetical protein [Planctomycetota bacterium]